MEKIACVTFWVKGDIPEDYDWSESLPEGVEFASDKYFDGIKVRTFPWSNVYHEVTWWIMRPMTMEEWIALDDAETEALEPILGDSYMGTAGPIPFDLDGKTYPEQMAEFEKENAS